VLDSLTVIFTGDVGNYHTPKFSGFLISFESTVCVYFNICIRAYHFIVYLVVDCYLLFDESDVTGRR
jgi:hypothetical protein